MGQSSEQDEPQDVHPYAGRWVARLKGQIVGQGGTPEQALKAAKGARFKEKPEITYMPNPKRIHLPKVMQRVASALPGDAGVYLAGGAVRDLLLGRESKDFDLAVRGEAIPLARKAADALRGDFYVLDEERDAGRVLLEGNVTLDFTRLRGANIDEDLAARDFSINAMALDLRAPEGLLDPLGGAADLHANMLRACSAKAFEVDPVRVLRAIRMAATFDLKIERDSRKQMKKAVKRLPETSAERLRDEVFRLMMAPKPATSLRALDILGAVDVILPELSPMKGCVQDEDQRYDVWEHCLHVMESLERIMGLLDETYPAEGAGDLYGGLIVGALGRYRGQISAHLKGELVRGRPRRALLLFAALYHDAGKPGTRVVVEGDVRFPDHQEEGARIVAERAEQLHMSNAEIQLLKGIVQHHSLPTILSKQEGGVGGREVYRYFRSTRETGVDICLHSPADLMGKYGAELPQHLLSKRLEVVRALLQGYWEHQDEVVDPPALISGDEIMRKTGLEAGPQVGEILEALREAQAAGEVKSKGEAMELTQALAKD